MRKPLFFRWELDEPLILNNSLLLGLQKEKLTRLQRVQNAAARLIAGLRKKDHITPTLKRLHWLPIEQRIIYKVLVLVYKALSGEGPLYLQELLQRYVPLRKLRIEQDNLLCVPNCNFVNTERRAFGIRAPAEWNKLPRNLRCKDTLVSFKSGLKTFLFQVAYEWLFKFSVKDWTKLCLTVIFNVLFFKPVIITCVFAYVIFLLILLLFF